MRADVCVVGGGLAGVATALELAERGRQVVLVEAGRLGDGASGRNGGQVLAGYGAGLGAIERRLGRDWARRLWDLSVEGVTCLRGRIARHAIECSFRPGYLYLALKPSQLRAIVEEARLAAESYGYPHLRLLDPGELAEHVGSDRYIGGFHDGEVGHFDPLRYLRGLAGAAEAAGAVVHEATPALRVAETGGGVRVDTPSGSVTAGQVALCTDAFLHRLAPQEAGRQIAVVTAACTTRPLDPALARRLLPSNAAVADANTVLDYYRMTPDQRLLFGGGVSYAGLEPRRPERGLARRIARVFPELDNVPLDHVWTGKVGLTASRLPDFGRIGQAIYYAQGFSGHGVALTQLAGRLIAEAMAGDAERFDVVARLPHRPFPGGPLRRPALALGMLYHRLRDLLW